jgi:hypothetical protein
MGSMTGPDFLGEILGYTRLSLPRRTTLPAGYHGAFNVRFPSLALGESQPILSLTSGTRQLTCFVTETANGRGKIATRSKDGFESSSVEVGLETQHEHVLVFEPDSGRDNGDQMTLSISLDGRRILGNAKPASLTSPAVVVAGLDQGQDQDIDVRFTGSLSDLELIPSVTLFQKAVPNSELHLVLAFPLLKDGRHEPLLTTGHSGAGDLVYVIYEDASHVRLGVDHWGGSGGVSDPIQIDYQLPHEIWIRTGALYPQDPADAAWQGATPAEQQKLKSGIDLVLDGRRVLSVPTTAHPSLPSEVTIGANKIGMSTADPEFGGRIEMAERTGLTPLTN